MFFLDIPPAPTAEVPVLVAQADYGVKGNVVMQDLTPQMLVSAVPPLVDAPVAPPAIVSQATTTITNKPNMTLGVCEDVQTPDNPNGQLGGQLAPVGALKIYWYNKFKEVLSVKDAKVTVLQEPLHGVLASTSPDETFGPYFEYAPNHGYLGQDKITFLVEVGGKSVKIVTTLYVVPIADSKGVNCFGGPKLINSIDQTNLSTGLASWLSTEQLAGILSDAAGVTVTISDLPGGAVGQTTGTNITLDTNAAGYNWFIDLTPSDNAEFLPTSNPNEWVAKVGSAAEGKMDMLSVLLHEYGHALGIDHSTDPNDYMGTILTAGVRRLPSADELALMQQLVAQAKDGLASNNTQDNVPTPFPTLPLGGSFGLAFLGRLRSSRYGGVSIVPDPSTLVTQYAVAANATFTNLDTAAGWNTQGSVDITPSTSSGRTAFATLNEVSTSQTRLSQVFMLNEQDRYLSFTLAGTALDDLNGAPDDAFEVALLDANTGASILGNDGLTRTDAFLNLQADGTEHKAQSVTRTDNSDGSRTYRVDLTGVAKNTAVNLSFDLIGFGQNNSHVTVRDIRLSGLPQLHDDAAILAEDNLLTFDPYAQADSQLKPALSSSVVNAPTHGALAVNADGTFSYTPDLNYFGADSFSYRLSDGSPSTGQPCLTIKYGIGINAVA